MPPLRDRIEDLPRARAALPAIATSAKFRKTGRGICRLGAEDPGVILVAGQHPRAREPDRARSWRSATRSGSPTRICRSNITSRSSTAGLDGERDADSRKRATRFERNFILRALEKSDWNVTATARYLGHPLSTLKHKMAAPATCGIWPASSAGASTSSQHAQNYGSIG